MFLTATKSNLKELWTIHTTKYVIFVQKQKQGDGVFITFKVTKLFLICVYCIRVVINWSLPVMSLLILSIIEFIRKIYDYSYDENKLIEIWLILMLCLTIKNWWGYHILTDTRGIFASINQNMIFHILLYAIFSCKNRYYHYGKNICIFCYKTQTHIFLLQAKVYSSINIFCIQAVHSV